MRFWDSSAVIPLLVEQEASARVVGWVAGDDAMVLWTLTPVEVEPVKTLATRLLRVHPLRAFDALQLGAALHWAEGHSQGRTLHTLDRRRALAAQREGFAVPS